MTNLIYQDDTHSDPKRRAEHLLQEARPYFEERWRCYQRAFRFYKGDQWTQAEVRAFYQQHRKNYVFNEVASKVDHLMGVQRRTRTAPVVRSRSPEQAHMADAMTDRLDVIMDLSDCEYVESDVFLDSLLAGYGAAAVRVDTEVSGNIRIDRIPPYEVVWDGTATDRALTGARWLARSSVQPRQLAAERFPGFAHIIQRGGQGGLDELSVTPEPPQLWRRPRHDEVRIIEFYERTKVRVWQVTDEIAGTTERFNTKAAAEDYHKGLITGYTLEGALVFDADGTSLIRTNEGTRNTIWQILIIGGELVLHRETSLPAFPYIINFCNFHDGHFWAFVDQLIDPQILINRYITQWDYQLGTSVRNAVTVMESLLRRGWKTEDVRRELSKTSPVLPVLSHGAVGTINGKSPDPALFQGVDMAMNRMVDYSGGRNYLGLTENAAESGRAVSERINASSLARYALWDNLRLFRRRLFTLVLWYELCLTTGDAPESLDAMELTISLEETAATDSQREREFSQMKELLQSLGGPPEVAIKVMIELSSLSQSRKDELLSMLTFHQQYAQQQASKEEDAGIQRSVTKSLKRAALKHQMQTTGMPGP